MDATCRVERLGDGLQIELFEKDRTTFKVGRRATGLLMPAMSEAAKGLGENETKSFTVKPDEQSHPQPGGRKSSLVVHGVPYSDEPPALGALVRYRHEGAYRLARVTKVFDESITIDMNDPLAGETLHVTMTVLRIRKGTDAVVPTRVLDPVLVPPKTFTLGDLRTQDGRRGRSIYISVKGFVYDVTEGREFYGPGGGYAFMAGRDATVCLARMSLDPSLLNSDWSGLEEESLQVLADYVRLFNRKYPCVGTLRDGEIQNDR